MLNDLAIPAFRDAFAALPAAMPILLPACPQLLKPLFRPGRTFLEKWGLVNGGGNVTLPAGHGQVFMH
jgi:hypothetical protein